MNDHLSFIVEQYFQRSDFKYEAVSLGLTNKTYKLYVNNNVYIVRIYNKHTKTYEGINLELAITSFLAQSKLSFQIPQFLQTSKGKNIVHLGNNTYAVILNFIEGEVPFLKTSDNAYLYGKVLGELSLKLSQYRQLSDDDYRGMPFSQLFELHQLSTKQNISKFFTETDILSDWEKEYYRNSLLSVQIKLAQLSPLKMQFVHHDVLMFNLLSSNNVIHAVLDFDFISYDFEIIELVIALIHIIQLTNGSFEMVAAFIKGYTDFKDVSFELIEHFEILHHMYHIVLLHIYIGQYYAGKEINSPFIYIFNQMRNIDKWMITNSTALNELFLSYIK